MSIHCFSYTGDQRDILHKLYLFNRTRRSKSTFDFHSYKPRITDIWKHEVDEKKFLAKLESAQVIFTLTEVIAFAPLAHKVFVKKLSGEDVIKFHVNPIRSRHSNQKKGIAITPQHARDIALFERLLIEHLPQEMPSKKACYKSSPGCRAHACRRRRLAEFALWSEDTLRNVLRDERDKLVKDPDFYQAKNQHELDIFLRKCMQVFEIRLVTYRMNIDRVQYAQMWLTGDIFDVWNRKYESLLEDPS